MHARHESNRDAQREAGHTFHGPPMNPHCGSECHLCSWCPLPRERHVELQQHIVTASNSRQQGCLLVLPSSAQDGTLIFESKKPKCPRPCRPMSHLQARRYRSTATFHFINHFLETRFHVKDLYLKLPSVVAELNVRVQLGMSGHHLKKVNITTSITVPFTNRYHLVQLHPLSRGVHHRSLWECSTLDQMPVLLEDAEPQGVIKREARFP